MLRRLAPRFLPAVLAIGLCGVSSSVLPCGAGGLSLLGVARADDADTAVPPGVQALAEALKDKDADVRKNAALSLGRYGERAVSAIPALIEALKDGAVDVRGAAAVS